AHSVFAACTCPAQQGRCCPRLQAISQPPRMDFSSWLTPCVAILPVTHTVASVQTVLARWCEEEFLFNVCSHLKARHHRAEREELAIISPGTVKNHECSAESSRKIPIN